MLILIQNLDLAGSNLGSGPIRIHKIHWISSHIWIWIRCTPKNIHNQHIKSKWDLYMGWISNTIFQDQQLRTRPLLNKLSSYETSRTAIDIDKVQCFCWGTWNFELRMLAWIDVTTPLWLNNSLARAAAQPAHRTGPNNQNCSALKWRRHSVKTALHCNDVIQSKTLKHVDYFWKRTRAATSTGVSISSGNFISVSAALYFFNLYIQIKTLISDWEIHKLILTPDFLLLVSSILLQVFNYCNIINTYLHVVFCCNNKTSLSSVNESTYILNLSYTKGRFMKSQFGAKFYYE